MTNYQLMTLIGFLGIYTDNKNFKRFGIALLIIDFLIWGIFSKMV